MDLGITGRKAIVCAASKGLGKACAMSLARNGASLVINGRNAETLEDTAREIREATGADVLTVAVDITTAQGREAVLAACPEPDILVNNAGGPPPGDFREWGEGEWVAALRANMLTPIELIRATVDGMAARGFGRVVNITSSAVKAPIAELGLSNGARAGLTGFVAGTARALAATGVTINNILPGRFETDRLRSGFAAKARSQGRPESEIEAASRAQIPARRFGRPEEFGELCAYLCSVQAGYITAQNVLIDGGLVSSTM
ncbi:SDR family oxidoreductase [Marinimicrococcus flavescens]|uniref:SDR family oxidoreductase n=1 Tax=Marinimicrococcus flavescens TaxID=3031815 RepID=A0AAP3UY33_9PROT|nr:SDR family oxidoreductase [Marinimicrococcus flavescens]